MKHPHLKGKIPPGLSDVIERDIEEVLRTVKAAGRQTAIQKAAYNALADSLDKETAALLADEVSESVMLELKQVGELLWGQLGSRSQAYTDASYSTFENQTKEREGDNGAVGVRRVTEQDGNVCDGCAGAATEEYVGLDEIADIGDFECGGRDRCTFEFSYAGIEGLTINRDIYA